MNESNPIPSKVQTKEKVKNNNITLETSFVDALHAKYIDQDEFDDQFIIPKDRSISTEITFVGFKRVTNVQRQLSKLTSIDLSCKNIKIAGDVTRIHGSTQRVTVLNVAKNNLNWTEIIKIVSCFPNLRELVLSSNDLLSQDNSIICFPQQLHKKLVSITLGKTNLTWSRIIGILSNIWISIDQIDLWDSGLTNERLSLDIDYKCFNFAQSTTELKLSENYLIGLDWIERIGPFTNLKVLDLSRCHIEELHINKDVRVNLQNLETLNISYNQINDWISVSHLNDLPKLTHLICNENPFFILHPAAKLVVIARISKLSMLNREPISNSIRRDAEVYYMRQIHKEYQLHTADEFNKLHPRYSELVDEYGRPEDSNESKTSNNYIEVLVCFEGKQIKKKLCDNVRVSTVEMMCKKLFKLKLSSKLSISCCTQSGQDSICYPLEKTSQTLHFFSVKNNDKLIISIID